MSPQARAGRERNATVPCASGAVGDTMSAVTPRGRRGVSAAGLAVLALAASSCGRFSADPARQVAIEVGGKPVTVEQLQRYFAANLMTPEGSEDRQAGELDRVKSRLLDDYIDEEILLQEAQRRGITASDADVAEYAGSEASSDPAARELARREVLVQKLREAVVLGQAPVREEEIDAWLAANEQPGAAPLHGTLRVLRFASYPDAARVRAELASKKLTFMQAEQTYGSEGGRGVAPEVDLGALPDRLADAVKGLTPGQVSQPVPFESSVLLLLLESIDDPSVADTRRRDRARRQVALDKAGAVAGRLLADLRGRTSVKLHAAALPFSYVAESRTPGTQ